MESDNSFLRHRNLRRRCQIPTVFVLRKKTKIRNVPEKKSYKKRCSELFLLFLERSNHCCVSKHRQQQQWCQQQLLVSVLPTTYAKIFMAKTFGDICQILVNLPNWKMIFPPWKCFFFCLFRLHIFQSPF